MKIHQYNIKSEKSPEEQIIRENEIMSKIFLEIMLKYSDKKHTEKTEEQLMEIFNQPDWREKAQFEIGDYYNKKGEYRGECLGHFWSIPWIVSAREPIEIIERLNKEKKEEIERRKVTTKVIVGFSEQLEEKNEKIKELEKELEKKKALIEKLENKLEEAQNNQLTAQIEIKK